MHRSFWLKKSHFSRPKKSIANSLALKMHKHLSRSKKRSNICMLKKMHNHFSMPKK